MKGELQKTLNSPQTIIDTEPVEGRAAEDREQPPDHYWLDFARRIILEKIPSKIMNHAGFCRSMLKNSSKVMPDLSLHIPLSLNLSTCRHSDLESHLKLIPGFRACLRVLLKLFPPVIRTSFPELKIVLHEDIR